MKTNFCLCNNNKFYCARWGKNTECIYRFAEDESYCIYSEPNKIMGYTVSHCCTNEKAQLHYMMSEKI